ncbi:MAG: hypothetical protein KJN76_13560 [Eudoraea sp.]|nr:hypothetical protein [Eudoraea sp.]
MFVTVVFILLLLLILYVLFVPINLFIDTSSNQYYVQITGLAKVHLEGHKEEVIRIKLKTLFMKFYFYPLKKLGTSKKKKQKKEAVKKKSTRFGFKKVLRLLRSFKVKRFLLDVDTGDCISNARLYPVFAFLNYYVGAFHVNFQGRNRLAVHLQNRPINIIKSFINF